MREDLLEQICKLVLRQQIVPARLYMYGLLVSHVPTHCVFLSGCMWLFLLCSCMCTRCTLYSMCSRSDL